MRALGIAIVGAVLGTVFNAGPVLAEDAGVQVIKKAIAAHGGTDNLRKAQSVRGKVTATASPNGTPITAEVEYTYRLPDYERVTITQATGDPNKVVRVVAKDQFYFKYGDRFIELNRDVQIDKKAALRIYYICTLTPLLTDKAYTVSLAGEQAFGTSKATGVRVQKGSESDAILYFDNSSGLLVRVAFQGYNGQNQKWTKHEFVYSDYKAIDGVMRAMTTELHSDGKLFIKTVVREEKLGQEIKDDEFAKP